VKAYFGEKKFKIQSKIFLSDDIEVPLRKFINLFFFFSAAIKPQTKITNCRICQKK
jgi:hypothetical protein